jgi:hypothetical protein
MKKLLCAFSLFATLAVWGPLGCSNGNVDTAKLQSAFPSAVPEVQTNLDKGIAAINCGNFTAALPALQRVAYAAKMTPDQRAIIEDAIKKVKAKVK